MMKKTKNKNIKKLNGSTKFLIALIIIILVAGIIVTCTKGFKFDLNYGEGKKIELNIGKQFDRKDIRAITNDVLGKKNVQIQEIEVYKDAASITAKDITEDQKNEIVSKVNEKYGTELKAEDITIEENSHIRGRKIIKPYVKPFVIVSIIILAYFMIRYYKLNSFKVLVQAFCIMILGQALLFAIMAITRVPLGTVTAPAMILVYIISTYICVAKFDQDLEKIKDLEIKNK